MWKWNDLISYKKINSILDIIGALLIIGLILVTFFIWNQSPDIVPMHYNFQGEVDGYGSKNSIFILLFIGVVCYVLIAVLSRYPQIYNYCVEINAGNKEKQYQIAKTFMKITNVEVTGIFLFVQSNIVKSIITGNENISVIFVPVILIILTCTIGIYKAVNKK